MKTLILIKTLLILNSDLIRNSYPYKVSDEFADNDFIIESNEITTQSSIVESTTSGSVNSIKIVNSGDGYEIGDNAVFDNKGKWWWFECHCKQIAGKEVTSIDTTVDTLITLYLLGKWWNCFGIYLNCTFFK